MSLLLAGCSDKMPPDSYRLKVTELFASEDEIVTSLTIETAETGEYSIRAEETNGWSFGCIGATDMPNRGGHHLGLAWIVGSRISAGDSTNDYAKILVRTRSSGELTQPLSGVTAQGSMYPPIPKASTLKDIFSLAVRDGVYRCEAPLIIGQVRGAELKLLVGPKAGETKKAMKPNHTDRNQPFSSVTNSTSAAAGPSH